MPFEELDIEFPELAAVIGRLRLGNPRLDEICCDYELLLGDYRQPGDEAIASGSPHISDLEETLADLLEEIAKALGVERRSP